VFIIDNTYMNMTTDVAVGRQAGAPAAAAPRRTVSTTSIRSVVTTYVKYRSSRRISNDSKSAEIVGEDQIDGLTSDVDNNVSTNVPRDIELAVRVLCKEFEQRYEQAS